jgi:hypothetical protein
MEKNSGTILIKNKTKERLKQIGKKGDTYDKLINELIKLKASCNQDSLDYGVGSLQSSESLNT